VGTIAKKYRIGTSVGIIFGCARNFNQVANATDPMATSNLTEFPTSYDLFITKGAYLYSFVPGYVQSGFSYNYKISVPDAQEVAFITNVDGNSPVFHKLNKNGQTFEGTINIVKGKMRISAKFPGENTYWALLEYTGQ
jgi:hypothetical protein